MSAGGPSRRRGDPRGPGPDGPRRDAPVGARELIAAGTPAARRHPASAEARRRPSRVARRRAPGGQGRRRPGCRCQDRAGTDRSRPRPAGRAVDRARRRPAGLGRGRDPQGLAPRYRPGRGLADRARSHSGAFAGHPGCRRAVRAGGPTRATAEAARTVALDGFVGELLIEPSCGRAGGHRAPGHAQSRRGRPGGGLARPARCNQGRPRRPALANLGGPGEVDRRARPAPRASACSGPSSCFWAGPGPPAEDDQARAYRSVLAAFGPSVRVVIRLADIGGDKEIPYLGLAAEANPFLGVRAIRLARSRPELLIGQLRAIARAGPQRRTRSPT